MKHNQTSKKFSFCSKATATFSTMEQATEQLQNERQVTQDIGYPTLRNETINENNSGPGDGGGGGGTSG